MTSATIRPPFGTRERRVRSLPWLFLCFGLQLTETTFAQSTFLQRLSPFAARILASSSTRPAPSTGPLVNRTFPLPEPSTARSASSQLWSSARSSRGSLREASSSQTRSSAASVVHPGRRGREGCRRTIPTREVTCLRQWTSTSLAGRHLATGRKCRPLLFLQVLVACLP